MNPNYNGNIDIDDDIIGIRLFMSDYEPIDINVITEFNRVDETFDNTMISQYMPQGPMLETNIIPEDLVEVEQIIYERIISGSYETED